MEAIFDLIIIQVIAFVKGQIAFTKHKYQCSAARRWFRLKFRVSVVSLLPSSIEVRQPPNNSMGRGAVMMGSQSDVVQSRAARSHCGLDLEKLLLY